MANILDNEVLHRLGHGCTESLEDVRHVEAGIAMAQSNVSFAGSPEPLRNLMYGDTTLLTAAILLVLRAMGPAGTPRAVVR